MNQNALLGEAAAALRSLLEDVDITQGDDAFEEVVQARAVLGKIDKAINDGASIPRILIVVKGGVADYYSDDGVDVETFDFDNYEADLEFKMMDKVPANYADLAELAGAPCDAGSLPCEAGEQPCEAGGELTPIPGS